MATVNPTIRQIPRNRLFEVLKSRDLVDLFEDVLYGVGTTLPQGIDDAAGAAGIAAGLADAAQATAVSAQSNLNAHITDAIDAHDASAISVVPTVAFAVTDVQAVVALLGTLAKQAANAVAITGGSVDATPIGATTPAAGTFTTLEAASFVKTDPTTVAALPAAAVAGDGARAFVTDATATTFLSVVAGGGANKVPVVSAGGAWLIG